MRTAEYFQIEYVPKSSKFKLKTKTRTVIFFSLKLQITQKIPPIQEASGIYIYIYIKDTTNLKSRKVDDNRLTTTAKCFFCNSKV